MNRVVILGLVTLAVSLTGAGHAQEAIAPKATSTVPLDTDGDGISDDLDACPKVAGPSDENLKKNGCTPRGLAKRWVITFMEKYAPPGRKTYIADAVETKEAAEERYDSIADDLLDVVYSPDTKPLFAGPAGRAQTASILLGIIFWETSFRKDVDFGLGKHSRGDHGESWCLMQVKVGDKRTADWNVRFDRAAQPSDPPEEVRPGYTGEDLVHNRKLCLSEGLKIVRGSFGACRSLPLNERLSSYASGSCDKGREASKTRMNTGIQWFYNYPRLFKDADLLIPQNYLASADPPSPTILAQSP